MLVTDADQWWQTSKAFSIWMNAILFLWLLTLDFGLSGAVSYQNVYARLTLGRQLPTISNNPVTFCVSPPHSAIQGPLSRSCPALALFLSRWLIQNIILSECFTEFRNIRVWLSNPVVLIANKCLCKMSARIFHKSSHCDYSQLVTILASKWFVQPLYYFSCYLKNALIKVSYFSNIYSQSKVHNLRSMSVVLLASSHDCHVGTDEHR
jgi:hypothetical protein